jgi:hypothetical protein
MMSPNEGIVAVRLSKHHESSQFIKAEEEEHMSLSE